MFLSVYILNEPSDPGHRLKAPISSVRPYRIVSTQLRPEPEVRIAVNPLRRYFLSYRKHLYYLNFGLKQGISAVHFYLSLN
jgi:hypothetical protein